jgi:5-methylcytosine-specific restriction endonuclease McrA
LWWMIARKSPLAHARIYRGIVEVVANDRDKIPRKTKLRVRQRCGFGCVICGHPIYQIDHMVDHAVVQEHKAANLTLLCPRHHDEKTKGLLPLAELINRVR